MWIQYGRLEMSYIAKIHARRQILGIEQPAGTTIPEPQTEGEDFVDVAKNTDHNMEASHEDGAGEMALRKLESIPAQNGAIPIAIFDEAMSQFNHDPGVAHAYVEMLADYSDLPAARIVLLHIGEGLRRRQCKHPIVHVCEVQLPVLGVPVTSIEFPGAFRESLKRLKEARMVVDHEDGLGAWARHWLQSLLKNDDLDPALQTVAKAVLKSLEGH